MNLNELLVIIACVVVLSIFSQLMIYCIVSMKVFNIRKYRGWSSQQLFSGSNNKLREKIKALYLSGAIHKIKEDGKLLSFQDKVRWYNRGNYYVIHVSDEGVPDTIYYRGAYSKNCIVFSMVDTMMFMLS
ncbi:MAG: hypothetical protein K8S56_08550 [Candidatus Cloacimonetes bacterium]|nr:hypothetical protein [Candidatus Cloacimonadota bacterium]